MYRHDAHAGNHGDVLKHAVLTLLLESLRDLPGPRLYAETHAGAGLYRIAEGIHAASASAAWGIGRLWPYRADFPELAAYFEAVRTLSPDAAPSRYPGSPWLARRLLAPEDRLLLFEIQRTQAARLRGTLGEDARIDIQCGDRLTGLPHRLSGSDGAGLVLIDPPYSSASEDGLACASAARIRARWQSATIALWYPRHANGQDRHERRVEQLRRRSKRLLIAEIDARPMAGANRMIGSGMALLDPPAGIVGQVTALLPRLAERLADPGTLGSAWRLREHRRDS